MRKISLFLIIYLMPLLVFGLEYPKLDSKMVEIYDLTDNKILYEVDAKEKTSIASLTKIATTITAIENIKDLDKEVVITRDMLSTVNQVSSVAGLKVGDKVTYRDLLYASMVPSGADATNSLAILSSGSISNFVKKMNELAKKIGLNNTRFVNVTGLDTDNHYSTLDDVRKLLTYSLQNELFKEIYTTRNYTLTNGLKVESTLYLYTKGVNLDLKPILGSKTGHTKKAGYALSSLSNINGHEVIIIVLKATQKGLNYYNIIDSLNLIKFLNQHYKNQILVEKGKIIKTLPVKLSKIESYDIKSNNDITKYLPSDYDKNKIRIDYEGLEELSFKNKKDSKIGRINYYFDNELIGSEDVLLKESIRIDLLKVLSEYYYVIIVIIVLISFMFWKKKRKVKLA